MLGVLLEGRCVDKAGSGGCFFFTFFVGLS